MTMHERFSLAALRFVSAQRVGRLATADAVGTPHVVPVCFAVDAHTSHLYIVIDDKPKRAPDRRLKRVQNLLERPEVSLVVDQYTEDWSQLGYVLIHALSEVLDPGNERHAHALVLLRERYPQYAAMALEQRLVIGLTPTKITTWGTAAAPAGLLDAPRPRPTGGTDFLAVARARRSVRQFTDRAVSSELLETVLEAARWAPSPHGRQPWRFAVITRDVVKARLADAMADAWQRNLQMDQQPADIVGARLRKSRARILQAPVLLVPCLYLGDLDRYPDLERQQAETTMAVQSLGAAIQNLLLAAYSLGLDTGWMCAPLFCPDVVCEALALDPRLLPHALITLGYAAKDPVRRPRRQLTDLVLVCD